MRYSKFILKRDLTFRHLTSSFPPRARARSHRPPRPRGNTAEPGPPRRAGVGGPGTLRQQGRGDRRGPMPPRRCSVLRGAPAPAAPVLPGRRGCANPNRPSPNPALGAATLSPPFLRAAVRGSETEAGLSIRCSNDQRPRKPVANGCGGARREGSGISAGARAQAVKDAGAASAPAVKPPTPRLASYGPGHFSKAQHPFDLCA